MWACFCVAVRLSRYYGECVCFDIVCWRSVCVCGGLWLCFWVCCCVLVVALGCVCMFAGAVCVDCVRARWWIVFMRGGGGLWDDLTCFFIDDYLCVSCALFVFNHWLRTHTHTRSAPIQTTFYPLNSASIMTNKRSKAAETTGFAVFTRSPMGVSSRGNVPVDDPAHATAGPVRSARLKAMFGGANSSVVWDESLVGYNASGAGLEIMMHRHLKRDDGRGLAQVCVLHRDVCVCVTVCACVCVYIYICVCACKT